MSDICETDVKWRRSLNVGIHAYQCLPGLVFVRVPNERGRYMIVDQAVAEVDCPSCGSITGEPCSNHRHGYWRSMRPPPPKVYTVTIHVDRKEAAKAYRWREFGTKQSGEKPKLKVSTADVVSVTPIVDDPQEAINESVSAVVFVLPRRQWITVDEAMNAADLKYSEVLDLCRDGLVEARKSYYPGTDAEEDHVASIGFNPHARKWWIEVESFRKWFDAYEG